MALQIDFKSLITETVTAPRSAAERVLALGLGKESLGLLVALVAVVNTILYSLSLSLFESSTGVQTGMNLPILYLMILTSVIVLGAVVLRWVGQMFGGQASLGQLLSLIVWLQVMRAIAQAGLLVLTLILPGLANMVALVLGLFGLWIMVNFLDVAQGWNSLGKSFLVMVLAGGGFVFGLSLFMLLIGASPMGV